MKDCNQCGKCCINYGGGGLAATQEEIDLWEIFNPEIYEYVKDGEIWFDPNSGTRFKRCPFLEVAPKSEPMEKRCLYLQYLFRQARRLPPLPESRF